LLIVNFVSVFNGRWLMSNDRHNVTNRNENTQIKVEIKTYST